MGGFMAYLIIWDPDEFQVKSTIDKIIEAHCDRATLDVVQKTFGLAEKRLFRYTSIVDSDLEKEPQAKIEGFLRHANAYEIIDGAVNLKAPYTITKA